MEPAVTDEFYAAEPDLVERVMDWRVAGDAGRTGQAAGVEAFDVDDRLDELTLPTLVMHGTADHTHGDRKYGWVGTLAERRDDRATSSLAAGTGYTWETAVLRRQGGTVSARRVRPAFHAV